MADRYQMVAANRNKVLGAAPSILGLFDVCGWEGEWKRWEGDRVVVRDTRKGTEMTREEYAALVIKLRGW